MGRAGCAAPLVRHAALGTRPLTEQGRYLKDQLEPIGQELKETLQRGVPPERIRAFTAALRTISSRLE